MSYIATWRRQWHPTPVLLPGKSYGRRSLVDFSPWGHEELDMTEQLYFHFPLSCIGEGNGNPLQCSCLENPRDGEAWWAAVDGVAQSRTWLKQLNSSSRSYHCKALWGSWAQGLSVSPISLIMGNRLYSASMTFPDFQGVDSRSCWLDKEGDMKLGTNS